MRSFYFKNLFFSISICANALGQDIVENSCDSTKLTKLEFEKCKTDSAWTKDIIVKTNYIIRFKTELLPKFRAVRKNLIISEELQNSLRQIKAIYDSVLNRKISIFLADSDMYQKYVQPKAYLSSLLSLQVFKFYPDIYAVLLNEIHLELTPKTPKAELYQYKQMINNLVRSIPFDLYQQLEKITTDMTTGNSELMSQGFSAVFQGTPDQSEKKKYGIVNFLLWND